MDKLYLANSVGSVGNLSVMSVRAVCSVRVVLKCYLCPCGCGQCW